MAVDQVVMKAPAGGGERPWGARQHPSPCRPGEQ